MDALGSPCLTPSHVKLNDAGSPAGSVFFVIVKLAAEAVLAVIMTAPSAMASAAAMRLWPVAILPPLLDNCRITNSFLSDFGPAA